MAAQYQPQTESGRDEDALNKTARYAPAPHTAAEKAALEAALAGPIRVRNGTRQALAVRTMTGAAVVAIAVALPDFSLGAMGAPETRVAMEETLQILPQSVWTPAVRAGQPVYAPVIASEAIAPQAVTISNRVRMSDFNRTMPIAVLESGSERFDLAFAGGFTGVELPQARIASASAGRPRQERSPVRLRSASVTRTRIIAVPQITDLPTMQHAQSGARSPDRASLGLSSPGAGGAVSANASLNASANASVEAAFAGPLGVSRDIRGALPVAPQAPNPPIREAVARVVPLSPAVPSPGADAAREAVIVPKSKLDARINGVLAGSIDFRQLDGTIAVRLRSVINFLRPQFSDDEFARLVSGNASDRFVTLAELQSAGIPISYNPAYDEVEFGIDHKDAPNAAKVQVQQISTPGTTGQSVMIEQIPR